MKALTHYRPLFTTGVKPFGFPLENRLRHFFGPDFFPEVYEEGFAWAPKIDLVRLENEWLLTAELPGMTLDDVEIDVVDDVLTFKGEKKFHKELKEENVRFAERTYGVFERSFTLPRGIEFEKIKAELENGVLFVHLPMTEETKGRKIPIKLK